jgi:hypothetical protein
MEGEIAGSLERRRAVFGPLRAIMLRKNEGFADDESNLCAENRGDFAVYHFLYNKEF